jgi:hypothetical protein
VEVGFEGGEGERRWGGGEHVHVYKSASMVHFRGMDWMIIDRISERVLGLFGLALG